MWDDGSLIKASGGGASVSEGIAALLKLSPIPLHNYATQRGIEKSETYERSKEKALAVRGWSNRSMSSHAMNCREEAVIYLQQIQKTREKDIDRCG
jgi:hypothetical protein